MFFLAPHGSVSPSEEGLCFIHSLTHSSKSWQQQRDTKQRLWVLCANDLSPPRLALVGGSYSYTGFMHLCAQRGPSGYGSVSPYLYKTKCDD